MVGADRGSPVDSPLVTIRRQVGLLFIAFIALVVLTGGGLVLVLARLQSISDELGNTRHARESAFNLQSALLDQETGVRGFVITGQDSFLTPYDAGRASAVDALAVLDAFTQHYPEAAAPLHSAESELALWQSEAVDPALAARRAGDLTKAAQLITVDAGQGRFSTVRQNLSTLGDLLARRENNLRRHGDAVRLWFGGALVAVVGLAALVSLVTGRTLRDQLLKPLGEVVEAVRQIRAGDLDRPVPVVGPRELQELSSAIDDMRRSILQLLQTEVASRQALEQEAVVTVQLSGSLASTSGELPEGWHTAAYLRPAEGIVAGDCYVMDLLGPDRIGLAVLDISGHGAAAALTALKAKEIIRSALRSGVDPDRALEMVQAGWADKGFLTAFVAVIDTRRGAVRYANAGHPPALVRTDASLVPLAATGPIVMAPQARWTVEIASMAQGDMLFVYTDGLTEARNGERDFYGEERLAEMLMSGDATPQATIDRCLADMEAFGAGEPNDDLTILVLGRSPVVQP